MINFKDFLKINESKNIIGNINKIKKLFNKEKIEYMFIGKGAAIIQGFPDSTKDVDVYLNNTEYNKRKIIKILKKLNFNIDKNKEIDVLSGKDFIQFNEPFEFDIIFAPDGFNNYEDALKYKINIDDFPLLNIDGIIKSKKAAGRKKDIMSIEDLEDFNLYVKSRKNR